MKKREKDKQTESEATDTETDEGMTREYFDAKQKELQDSRLRVQKKKKERIAWLKEVEATEKTKRTT